MLEDLRENIRAKMQEIERRLRRRSNYRATFTSPPGVAVLADLKRFCRPYTSSVMVSPQTGVIDPLAMAVNEGRREVFNRIVAHIHADDAELLKLKDEIDD